MRTANTSAGYGATHQLWPCFDRELTCGAVEIADKTNGLIERFRATVHPLATQRNAAVAGRSR